MRSNPLSAINSVAVAIGRFASLQEMLEYALDRVLEVVETEAGGVYLLDEAREELTLVVHRGLPEALTDDIRCIKLGEGLSGRVAQSGEPIILRNLKDDPRLIHQTAREEGLRGFASMPLRSNFKTYGTLNIHTHEDREFSEQDVQLLASMASQIGLAVANARLFMNLQASERKFRSLVENAEDLIYLTDRAGRLVYANPAFEHLLQLDPAALCESKRPILTLVHPADRDRVAGRLSVNHVLRALEFRMVYADGIRFRWFSQTSVPIRDESGETTGMQCIAHDITERREMQEQIAAAERLADLGRMAASLAHEIRNPLGAIVNSIIALKQPRAAGDHRLHDIITEEAHRLDVIISDFLLFARPPASVPVVCSVAELIETAVILFERSGRLEDIARRVRLAWSCPTDVPDVVADPNQMRQVLWNLISNAVDATGAEGTVDVTARVSPDGAGVAISVTDDGPGVQNVTEIFRPFFTTKAQGTGLGLAVVGRIVRNHGGIIRVDNVENRGARMTFTIPTRSGPAPRAAQSA